MGVRENPSGFQRWAFWAKYAIRVPSRVVILAGAVAGVVASGFTGGRSRRDEVSAPAYLVLFVGGVCIVVVVFGWRWFWYGRAVDEVRGRRGNR